VFITRAMCGIEYKSRRLVFEEQSASFSNCDQRLCMKLDDHCLWRDPRYRVLNSIQFICISISLLILNKLLYIWLLQVCEACPTYCKCVRPAQLIASVWDLPNLLQVCEACPTYCKCVRPAQVPVLTEVRAPFLWEHPWYVPHVDRPGYNRIHQIRINTT
jgi:hypothetical protein